MTGVLVLAGTPIGNPDDAPPRLREELAAADIVAAEDTRRLRRLVTALGAAMPDRVVSYFEGNESSRTPELIDTMTSGDRVLLLTDAGMPSVSDPGYRLVSAAVDAGVTVTAVPGPSAVLTALAVSGLPVDRFCFEGFPPRRAGERDRAFAALADEARTLVFFESRHRVAATLAAMATAFGEARRVAVCRELTKTYEEIRRGPVSEVAMWAAESGPRGEITIVVEGASPSRVAMTAEDAAEEVAVRVTDGADRKQAIADVAREARLRKRDVYDAVVAQRRDDPDSPDGA